MNKCVLKKYIWIFCVDFIAALIMCVISAWGGDYDLGKAGIVIIVCLTYIAFAFLCGIINCLIVKSIIFPTIIMALSICISELIVYTVLLFDFVPNINLSVGNGSIVLGVGISAVFIGFISGAITKTVLYIMKRFSAH